MIERNLGNTERVMRLIGAFILAAWAASRETHDLLTPLALLISGALTLNFLFSRCYLWRLLGLNTCDESSGDCSPPQQH